MADDLPEIKARLTLDDSQVADVMAKVGKQAEGMGKQLKTSGEYGEAGMRILGASAHEAAQSLGLPGPIARRLATQIEDTVMSFGKFAAGVGIATVVVTAGIAIYKHFHDQLVKNREEILKNSASAESWIRSAYGAQAQTVGMTRATIALTEAERILNEQRLRQGIGEEKRILTEQEEKLGKLAHTYNVYNEQLTTAENQHSVMLPLMEKIQKNRDLEYTALQNEIGVRRARIGVMREELNIASQQVTKAPAINSSQYIKEQGEVAIELLKSQGADEFTLFASQWEIKLAYLRAANTSAYEINRQFEITDIQSKGIYNARQLAVDKQLMDYKFNTMAAGLELINTVTRGKYKVLYLAMQGIQAGQAIMSAHSASAAALALPPLGLGPVAGQPLSFWALANGYAHAAAIMAQAFMSPSGGGGGATPTFDANPTTGLPTSSDSGSGRGDIYISIDGGKNYDKLQLATDVAGEIYRNNGSIGGFSVAVERSA